MDIQLPSPPDAAWEHTEQLYLLEVLVDEVVVAKDQDRCYSYESPLLTLAGRIGFLDLPEMEVQPNELAHKKPGMKVVWDRAEEPRIPGLPDDWEVTEATDLQDYKCFPQYRVVIEVFNRDEMKSFLVTLLVPKKAVDAGEGLRYTFTALEQKVDKNIMKVLKEQFKEALEKEKFKDHDVPVLFASGKSCLFQMSPYDLITALKRYPFFVSIFRRGVVDGIPINHVIGKLKLDISVKFVKAVTESEAAGALPISAHLEDTYPLTNLFGKKSGSVGLFVRLSCFGCSISRPLPEPEEPPQEVAKTGKKRRRPAMWSAEEAHLTGGGCADRSGRSDRRPIVWRRAEEALPKDFSPELAKLMPALRELPPPPPAKLPPPDPWSRLEGLERCAPGVEPPCYRKPGDMPLPRCEQQATVQLTREQNTRGVQTDPCEPVSRLPPDSPYLRMAPTTSKM